MMPTHTFRTGKGDEDIEDILSRVPMSARSWFIKEAVRFHAGLRDDCLLYTSDAADE